LVNQTEYIRRKLEKMKATRMHEFGGPEVLKYEDCPSPPPARDWRWWTFRPSA
jgi:hypothetical protein